MEDLKKPNEEGASCHSSSGRKVRTVGVVLVLGAVAYWLFTEHRAHTLAFLPYAFLLACPLMHIFMHRGHGHHRQESGDKR